MDLRHQSSAMCIIMLGGEDTLSGKDAKILDHYGGRKTPRIPLSQRQKEDKTRRERLKSALYLRLKRRKTFLEKNLKFSKKNSSGKCRTVPKNVKGGTLFDL